MPLVPLPANCRQGIFLRRVKRFSVEVEMDGQSIWAHCNNSGAMFGLLNKGARVLLSPAPGAHRKLAWTLERMELPSLSKFAQAHAEPAWVGVNTGLPNKILEAAFRAGKLDFARNYGAIKREAARGQSRLDALFHDAGQPPLWVECKNVTMVEDDCACFPDATSLRAQKHLHELMDIARQGQRAAMFYLVQRPDGVCFGPADFVDAAYAELFYQALKAGVECYPYRAIMLPDGAAIGELLPLRKPIC